MRAPKVCSVPGCIGDADRKSGKCVDHQEAAWVRSTNREKRTPLFERNRRRALRSTKGRCAFCGVKAGAVDHRLPVAWGGDDEVDNLQPICEEHHRQKTRQESEIGRQRSLSAVEAHVERWTPPNARYRA